MGHVKDAVPGLIVTIGLCMMAIFCSNSAQAQFYGEPWVRSDVYEIVNGVGAAGADTSSPYVYAYEGQSSTHTYAQATYTRYFHTEYPPVTGGTLHYGWNFVGTLGLFDNPISPSYISSADDDFDEGPPDYNTTGGSSFGFSGKSYTHQTVLKADIHNYGHASAEYAAYVLAVF